MPFPSTPLVGDTYTMYGRVWVYDGSGWSAQSYATQVPMIYQVRTVSQLTAAAADANKAFRCVDAPGGEAIIYSDGTTYRRQSDSSPVVT